MIDRTELLKGLQALLPQIEKDILAYSEAKPELNAHLKSNIRKPARLSGRRSTLLPGARRRLAGRRGLGADHLCLCAFWRTMDCWPSLYWPDRSAMIMVATLAAGERTHGCLF